MLSRAAWPGLEAFASTLTRVTVWEFGERGLKDCSLSIGGGGGPAGPTPSDVDFEWNVTHDIESLDSGNDYLTDLWSDGETLWIAENGQGGGVFAYALASGERREGLEFEFDPTSRAPRGIWSDRKTVWVSDSGQDRLFAHDLEAGGRVPGRDIELDARNRYPQGIWSDGETMWVLDSDSDRLFAYALVGGELLAEYALHGTNGTPRGIWSDGSTFWVSEHVAEKLFAYRIEGEELVSVSGEEFTELSRAGNENPRGVWSDGDVIYVADAITDKVYSYNMPDAIDARLASLSMSDVDIGAFASGVLEYTGAATDGVAETTVAVAAVQGGATVAIEPPDGDALADGHQVAIEDGAEIVVAVTSVDGSRNKAYRVQIRDPVQVVMREDSLECLRSDITAGISLVVHQGGGVSELEACAQRRHVTAVYTLREGAFVSYIVGAREFVNRPFVELYADGIPSPTPLLTASDGPPTDGPGSGGDLDDILPRPWADCLRGDIAPGISLVLHEGAASRIWWPAHRGSG